MSYRLTTIVSWPLFLAAAIPLVSATAADARAEDAPAPVAIAPAPAPVAAEAGAAAPIAEPEEPAVTIDQQTFANYFTFGIESDMERLLARSSADIELKLRDISADSTITADQLDRIRLAAYAERAAEARRRFDGRRAIIGKQFPDLGAANSEYQRAVYSHYSHSSESAKTSLRKAVYDQVLTDQQKRNHKLLRAQRRDRLARACIVQKVSLLNQKVAMTQAQRVALAKLINKQMPPAGLYEDLYTGYVVNYALALVPPEELETLLDAYQRESLKPAFEVDMVHVRETLRHDGTLGRITAYRDAAEKSAASAEESVSQENESTPATP